MNRDSLTNERPDLERDDRHPDPGFQLDLSRRSFMKLLGAGLLITVAGDSALGQSEGRGGREGRGGGGGRGGPGGQAPQTIAARLHIGEDGVITVMTGKVEEGQGSRGEITQAAAEELRVPVDRVRLVMADTSVVPDDGITAGSMTTPRTLPPVRRAAATARELLVGMACAQWQLKPDEVEVRDGAITHKPTQRKITYAELAKSKDTATAFQSSVPGDVTLTQVGEWKIFGTSVPRPNIRDIFTGAHKYPSDMVRPNMLYGRILRAPSYGATLSSVDLSEAQAMKGVVVARDGEFVGCAAPTSFRAGQAIEAVAKTASWKTVPHPSSKELFPYLKQHVGASGGGGRQTGSRTEGSVEQGLAGASKTLNAAYEISYIQHVPLEPRAALAEWSDGRLTAWMGTDNPFGVRQELARAFNIASENVRVVVPDMGGGFGGKHTGEVAVEAARLAKAAERPVSLRWTRREEFTWAYFRPAGLIEIRAELDGKGSLVAWDFTNINSGGAAIDTPYKIPNANTQFVGSESPLRQSSYRCLAATANNFARESFMDELAAAAGADPLAFRIAHLENPRLRAVLEAAAKKFGWAERKGKTAKNVGVGLACGTEKNSVVAACVEVAIDRAQGKIEVREVCEVFECGAILNPANLRSQVEGCIIMGLGGALTEEIQFENGKILNASLAEYQVPRFKDVPRLDITLLDRPDLASAGGGETPIIAIAPAIANAVFNATGLRIRTMPIRGSALRQG